MATFRAGGDGADEIGYRITSEIGGHGAEKKAANVFGSDRSYSALARWPAENYAGHGSQLRRPNLAIQFGLNEARVPNGRSAHAVGVGQTSVADY